MVYSALSHVHETRRLEKNPKHIRTKVSPTNKDNMGTLNMTTVRRQIIEPHLPCKTACCDVSTRHDSRKL